MPTAPQVVMPAIRRYEPTLKTQVTTVAKAHGLTVQTLGAGASIPTTDHTAEFQLQHLPVRLQLLFSQNGAMVRVNLRACTRVFGTAPSTASGAEFQRYIEATFAHFYAGAKIVRVPRSPLCYFKPFAPRADGQQDVDFSLDGARVLIRPDWLEGKKRELNLSEALSALFGVLAEQRPEHAKPL